MVITQDFTTRDKFKFDNTREGLETLLRRAKTEMVKSGCRGVMFAIETCGRYWRNVAYFLDEQGIPFRFINQFTLKRRREGKDLNRRKNDYRDSEVAAQLLCTGEFTRVFKDPCGQTALSVLSICSIPTVIAQMTEEEFINTISVGHKGRLMRRKLRALHYAARTSIGIEAGAQSVSFEISFLVEKFQLIRRQVRIIDETLTGLVDETEEGKYLLSIRGLNYIAVAGLLAELGSFKY